MSTRNKSLFLAKIFHFHITNHIKADINITNWYVLTILKGFKSGFDKIHLLSNDVSPEVIAIIYVNIVDLVHTIGDSNARLARIFQKRALRFLTIKIIRSHFLLTCGTHQLNAGSPCRWWASYIQRSQSGVTRSSQLTFAKTLIHPYIGSTATS